MALEAERRVLEEDGDRQRSSRKGRGMRKGEDEGFESGIVAGLKKKRHDGLWNGNNNNYDGEGAVRLPEDGRLPSSSDRIKFIRISHLMVGHNPFRAWNVVTNILWSQLSRFELMGEMLMEASSAVDTIFLRPGELTNDERVANHTSLQLRIDGRVSYPSLVGREDVAKLAAVVVSALTKTCLDGTEFIEDDVAGGNPRSNRSSAPAHHYTWAVRWSGQHLGPPQGLRPDGLSSAALCFAKAVQEQIGVDSKRRQVERRVRSYHAGKELIRLKRRSQGMKIFAQSLAVSVPLYVAMGLLGWYMFGQMATDVFFRLKRLRLPLILLKLLPV